MSLLLLGLVFALSAAAEAAREITFTDYLLWKALAVIVLAFLAGLFGFIKTPPKRGGPGKRPE